MLASAAADARTIYRRAGEGAVTPVLDAVANTDAKAEMILIRHRRAEAAPAPAGVMGREERTAVSSMAPDWLTNTTPTASGPAPARGRVKIGVRWGDNDPAARDIDLDLYVLARPGVKELSYRRMRTPEGWLYKDWLTSPSVANGFETVELTGETDLRQLGVAVNSTLGTIPAAKSTPY